MLGPQRAGYVTCGAKAQAVLVLWLPRCVALGLLQILILQSLGSLIWVMNAAVFDIAWV